MGTVTVIEWRQNTFKKKDQQTSRYRPFTSRYRPWSRLHHTNHDQNRLDPHVCDPLSIPGHPDGAIQESFFERKAVSGFGSWKCWSILTVRMHESLLSFIFSVLRAIVGLPVYPAPLVDQGNMPLKNLTSKNMSAFLFTKTPKLALDWFLRISKQNENINYVTQVIYPQQSSRTYPWKIWVTGFFWGGPLRKMSEGKTT